MEYSLNKETLNVYVGGEETTIYNFNLAMAMHFWHGEEHLIVQTNFDSTPCLHSTMT